MPRYCIIHNVCSDIITLLFFLLSVMRHPYSVRKLILLQARTNSCCFLSHSRLISTDYSEAVLLSCILPVYSVCLLCLSSLFFVDTSWIANFLALHMYGFMVSLGEDFLLNWTNSWTFYSYFISGKSVILDQSTNDILVLINPHTIML